MIFFVRVYPLIIWINIILFVDGSYNAIPILYHPVQDSYTVSSMKTVKQMLTETKANHDIAIPSIILLCYQTASKNFNVEKTLATIDPKILEQFSNCTEEPKLNVFSNPESIQGYFTFAIGYEMNQGGRRVIIFYYKDTLLEQTRHSSDNIVNYGTMHHFRRYNRSMISEKTCEEYGTQAIDQNGNPDIDFKDIQTFFDEKTQDKFFENYDKKYYDQRQTITTYLDYFEQRFIRISKDHFVPHRMVPVNDFIEDNERMATCITYNFVPIWKIISLTSLRKVEEFIQRVAHVLHDQTLTVHTLTVGQLKWTTKTSKVEYIYRAPGIEKMEEADLVFLDPSQRKIPVPKNLLKIVGYRVPFTKTDDVTNLPKYYMVIVVKNATSTFEYLPRICNLRYEPICQENGWDISSNETMRDAQVYCCHIKDTDLKEIREKYKLDGETFDLHEVALYDLYEMQTKIDVTDALGDESLKNELYDPIPLLFYTEQNIYVVSTLEYVNEMISSTNAQKPAFSLVMYLCNQFTPLGYRYKIEAILPNNYPEFSKQVPRCKREPRLNTFKPTDTPGYFQLSAIGYETKDTYGVIIFYYNNIITGVGSQYLTMHNFHAYHRSLISTKTCKEYDVKVNNFNDPKKVLRHLQAYFDKKRQSTWFKGYNAEEKDYFVPHFMVPINDFIEDNKRKATCIASNVVPMWESVSQGAMKRVEEFIQQLANTLYDHTLTVYTIAKDQLEWQHLRKHEERVGTTNDLVFLDTRNKKIPIPKYFLKVVGYSVPFTTTDDIDHRPRYYMVIVIHNDIYENMPRICNINLDLICKVNGWNITSEEGRTANVYCCTMADLITTQSSFKVYQFKTGIFNLHKVVVSKTDNAVQKEIDVTTFLRANANLKNNSPNDYLYRTLN